MALLLLSCPNPRNCSIIIPRTAASASNSNARPLRRRLVGMNDYLERSCHHHPRRLQRWPEGERPCRADRELTERLPHRGPKFSHEKHSLRDATESDEKLFFECSKKIMSNPNGIAKKVNAEFLEWRYFKCPVHNYQFISDNNSFLVIFRLRQTILGKELRVVDVFYLKEIEKMDLGLVASAIEKTQKDLQVNYTSILGSNHGYSLKGLLTISKIPIGPVLTIKDLNLKNLKPDIFAKSNWNYSLGDMELF